MSEYKNTDRTTLSYFTEVGKHVLPTRAEEVRLFKAYEKSRALERVARTDGRDADALKFAKEKGVVAGHIAEGYLRFVIRQAIHRTKDPTLLLELISAGNVGLMEAIDRFEVDRGFKFLTYGAWWINVHMQEFMNRADAVHVPNHTRKEIRKRKREEEATLAQGAELTGPRVEEPTVGPLVSGLHADPNSDTEACAQDNERDMLRYMSEAQLNMRERLVLMYYFGLREATPRTFGEMSQLFYELDGSYITSERIRQIKEKALRTLKAHLAVCNIQTASDLL